MILAPSNFNCHQFGPRRSGAIVKAILREAFGRVGQPILPYSWVGLQPLASFIRGLKISDISPCLPFKNLVHFCNHLATQHSSKVLLDQFGCECMEEKSDAAEQRVANYQPENISRDNFSLLGSGPKSCINTFWLSRTTRPKGKPVENPVSCEGKKLCTNES